MIKCRMQFLNVYTQEILRDELMKQDVAERLFDSMVNPQSLKLRDKTTFLLDNQMRIYKAIYKFYTVSTDESVKIYRVFFHLKLNRKQLPINR